MCIVCSAEPLGLWWSRIVYGAIFCITKRQYIPQCWSAHICFRCGESWARQWHALLSVVLGGDIQGTICKRRSLDCMSNITNALVDIVFCRIPRKQRSSVWCTKWIWWPRSSVILFLKNARKIWKDCHCRWIAHAIERASGMRLYTGNMRHTRCTLDHALKLSPSIP